MAYAMNQLLEAMLENGASDLHIRVGRSPSLRVNGELVAVEGPALTAAETEALVFGAVPAAVKLAEAVAAAEAGADELDVVPDFGALADRQSTQIHDELAAICELGLPVKVILEVGRLDPDALALLVEISIDAGARFLKSGSGFGPAVTVDHIEQLRQLARGRAAIKASGGIANLEQALALVEAGATRLGTSRGVALAQAMRG